MENNKRLVSEEEIKENKRKKQLAIIKASNEMLAQAIETVMNTDKLDDYTRTERIRDINNAIEQNKMKAKTYLNATMKEVEDSVYQEASEEAKRKYKERLEKLGKSESDIERKDIAMVAVNKDDEKTSKRKHIVKRKRKEESEMVFENETIERLPNEEELMKKTMATEERIRQKMGENTKQEDKIEKEIKEQLEETKIKVVKKNKEQSTDTNKRRTKETANNTTSTAEVNYSFDFSSIPDYVQYDIIPLPSEGKCYPIDSPLRCGRIPVAYLTASDENIIASPNMYRDGKIIDVILERKILDKRINIQDLIKGDRDAIILWLRSTGYGPSYPIVASNPYNDKKYDINIDLTQLKYKDFNINSDENGNFEFITSNNDIIKFNFMTQKMLDDFRNEIILKNVNIERFNIISYLRNIEDCLSNVDNLSEEDINDIKGCVSDINDIIVDTNDNTFDENDVYNNSITEQMILYTKSINDNDNKDYIRQYIENMRANDSYKYRMFINDNNPGVDFKITINIPESDGGGSFDTFLKFGNDVFINI